MSKVQTYQGKQAVTYTLKVIISRKLCKMKTMSDLQGHSPIAKLLESDLSNTVVQQLTIFQLTKLVGRVSPR